MPKHAYQYGRKWDARTPRGEITWLVNREHVSATDEEIRALIRARVKPDWPAHIRRQCEDFASEHHKRNVALYCRVMR